jgi:DNA-binding LytR/AlgR family response regulator
MNPSNPTALIAEDEPLLAAALQAELARAWPELRVLATVGDGLSAVKQAMALAPDVLFFDIRMPGLSGLEAAAELADQWPPPGALDRPFPSLVFVTAFDEYAVQAFEAQAVDYLLKPVQAARLQKTVEKLKKASVNRSSEAIETEAAMEPVLARLRSLLAPEGGTGGPRLSVIAASLPGALGASIRMVPMEEVLYFEAADKYLRVLTGGAEYLIRTPLKELIAQLDPQVFWQIHRGTVVRASLIDTVTRDEAGKLSLSLRGRPERLPVSRLYAHLFRAM